MGKKVNLLLSDKAYENLSRMSKKLGLNQNEFASLCFEYVDFKHKGIISAAEKIKQKKVRPVLNKKELSRNLQQLSAEQIELLLYKAADKSKN